MRSIQIKHFVKFLVLLFGLFLVTASNCNTGGPVVTSEDKVECCSIPPPGFIKIDDDWDPNRCGNPSSISYNVCTFTRYDNQPVGAVLTVCVGPPIPSGWQEEPNSKVWVATRCGHPNDSNVLNVMRIKRVQ